MSPQTDRSKKLFKSLHKPIEARSDKRLH